MKFDTENLPLNLIVRGVTSLFALLAIGYALSDHPFYGGDPGFGGTQAVILALGIGVLLCLLLPLRLNGAVLLVCISGSIALLIAETVGEALLSAQYRSIYQSDDKLIFKLLPGRSSIYYRQPINGGQRVAHRINLDGFRGQELKPRGIGNRILVYGDSFIHAFYSPDEETFSVQLQGLLSSRMERPVEVINAGVSSYGPDQISLKMKDELPELEPDLIIVAIFAGNDYGDLLRNKLFKLDDGRLLSNDYTLAEDVRVRMELNLRESILKRALRNTLAKLRQRGIYAFLGETEVEPRLALMDFWLAEAKREHQNYILDGNNVVTNPQQDHYSADISLQPNSASARYKISLMDAIMRRIRDVSDQAQVPLVFLFIPHPIDVAEDYDWARVDTKRFSEYHRRNLVAPLEESAQTAGIHFVSLFDAYRQQDANQLYFHGGDDHWNAEGQKLAAELVADYLLENDLFQHRRE